MRIKDSILLDVALKIGEAVQMFVRMFALTYLGMVGTLTIPLLIFYFLAK